MMKMDKEFQMSLGKQARRKGIRKKQTDAHLAKVVLKWPPLMLYQHQDDLKATVMETIHHLRDLSQTKKGNLNRRASDFVEAVEMKLKVHGHANIVGDTIPEGDEEDDTDEDL